MKVWSLNSEVVFLSQLCRNILTWKLARSQKSSECIIKKCSCILFFTQKLFQIIGISFEVKKLKLFFFCSSCRSTWRRYQCTFPSTLWCSCPWTGTWQWCTPSPPGGWGVQRMPVWWWGHSGGWCVWPPVPFSSFPSCSHFLMGTGVSYIFSYNFNIN